MMTDLPERDDGSLPATDRTALDRLIRFGGGKLLGEMIDLFLATAPERIAAAHAGVSSADAKAVESALHALKSSSAQLGALRMSRLCARGESRAREGSLAGIPTLLERLDGEYARVRTWLASARHEDCVKTVAVIEDNADNRLLLHALLEDRYEVVEYENGADALAGMVARLPDLVLLDISLPGMDGNEILWHIRADERLKHLPVIALTAHAMAGDREKFLATGFNDYVTKPIVDEQVLLDAMQRWIAAGHDSRTRRDSEGYGLG